MQTSDQTQQVAVAISMRQPHEQPGVAGLVQSYEQPSVAGLLPSHEHHLAPNVATAASAAPSALTVTTGEPSETDAPIVTMPVNVQAQAQRALAEHGRDEETQVEGQQRQ